MPFRKGDKYDFDDTERENIRARFDRGDGLHLVVEWQGRLVGILDVVPQEWNDTAWIWNIMLDESIRGQGIGRALFERAVDVGAAAGLSRVGAGNADQQRPRLQVLRCDGLPRGRYPRDVLHEPGYAAQRSSDFLGVRIGRIGGCMAYRLFF